MDTREFYGTFLKARRRRPTPIGLTIAQRRQGQVRARSDLQ